MEIKTSYSEEELQKAKERQQQYLKQQSSTYKRLEDALHKVNTGRYMSDFVYGANDGIITTFAVVTGAAGAALSPLVIVILGFANLIADGFSMGASSFLSQRSDKDIEEGQRAKEAWEIEHLPELEVEETRETFARLGFTGEDLDKAVAVTIKDPKRWLDFMMIYEHGVVEDKKEQPWKHGLATFVAFVIAGLAPLLPFLLSPIAQNAMIYSPIFAGVTLFTAGSLRTLITPKKWWLGGLEMLLIGSIAGSVSYATGFLLKSIIGISI